MPPRRRRARARLTTRCAYVQGGRQCVRNGTGNPPLCRDHAADVADAVRHGDATGRDQFPRNGHIADAVRRTAAGERIPTSGIIGALGELLDFFAQGGPGAQRRTQQQPQQARRTQNVWDQMQEAAARAAEEARRRAQQHPPRPDPTAQRMAEIIDAKRVLGISGHEKLTEERIKSRQRELARKHHPDLGGSLEKMKAINAAADVLMATLEQRRATP